MIKTGMLIGDRYEILEKIGTGGMSDVYKAKCHKLNRYVAVKVLKQEFSENTNFVSKFRTEAQAAAGLMHPNIVNVYDVGEEDGIYYIVMELVEGITLKSYIEKKARLSVKEAISIAIQVSMGIEAAHNNHIIHRDIKPQNIMISKEGKVKIADFGIAKAATSNTITSNVMGSVHYTSPEQARGGFSDERSDIYSLGCTMFEMVTGRVPFDGETTVSIAIKHIQEEMPSPREFVGEIPISIEKIIFKCTQKSPDRRYQTIAALIADLKQSLISPDEDFVDLGPQLAGGETRAISEEEMAAIREHTGAVKLDMPEQQMRLREDLAKKPAQKKSRQEVYEEDEEEYDEDDLDPRMEKLTTVLAIVAAVIIGCIALALAWKLLGGIGNKSAIENGKPNTAQETENGDLIMISVLGMEEADAKRALHDMGLGVKTQTVASSYAKGQVCEQSVAQGESVLVNTTILLSISDGSLASEGVPNVVGMEENDAKKALEEAGYLVTVESIDTDEVAAGKVAQQSPQAGENAAAGSNVTISVSTGVSEGMVPMPDLRGKTEAEAKQLLEAAGLTVGTVTETSSEDVEAGRVVSQSYNPGINVSKTTAINFVISSGPKALTYKYVTSLSAPTGYTSGQVTVTITASDGDTRSFTTSTFPCAVNEAGFKVSSGTITYTYEQETVETGFDDETGQNATFMTTKTVTTQPVSITFTQE